jgi:hypothetical protein
MGKVTAKVEVSNVESLEDLRRFVSIALKDIAAQINGSLTIENLSIRVVPVSLTSGATTTVPHGLGRAPVIWISGSIEENAVIYQASPADISNLYLTASASVDAKILVI